VRGSLLDLECVARDLLDSLRDGIAVNGSKRNDPHDEKVERVLRKVKPVVCFLHAYGFYIYIARCRRSRYTHQSSAPTPYHAGIRQTSDGVPHDFRGEDLRKGGWATIIPESELYSRIRCLIL
jgi:hypothetical protein